ncbi:FAD-dependent oxidoreductase [Leptolyngbya sp. FACHB-261]|uniref:FAD-dependent oxidoreductase n=1 Tax=Leptolyngbya sp. FACHB-261 TaxID=2692806 RepID=UPI001689AC49|nr:FAD-dependent oxidoreductase [Leptolyngbya sp. FACHB-261]MBD2100346.1 FAD-dependent oxidoreductase [Leptolyngbya sp. FACHB-261]
MRKDSGQSTSVWMKTATVPERPSLAETLHADVCVVGAGIAGLTTAYLLAKQKKSVVVLEGREIGGGQTVRTTAHISTALDDRYYEIEDIHDQEAAKLVADSFTAAIARVESIVTTEKIDCDFERLDGYLFAATLDEAKELDKELAATHRAGLTPVEKLARSPITSFDTGPCLRFPQQAQFDPQKYMAGLAEAITRLGGRIYTHTHISEVKGGSPAQVQTREGLVVTANALVIATNSPINDRIFTHLKQAPYQTYVIAAKVPSGSIAKGLYWDTLDPYHYVRLQTMQADGQTYDLLIVGGEDHKTGQANDADARYAALETWTKERFPMVESIEFSWSGEVMESADGLAYIGQSPDQAENVYIATGDSGMGMTHGTIAGMLLTDLILGHENPWKDLYNPGRVPVGAASDLITEGLNVAAQYKDWVTGGDIDHAEQLTPGTGAIVRRGLTKVAAYRDEAGELHECSAVCPHLGCIVAWNSSEKSFDCPCHGSRFSAEGEVLNAPAIKGLSPANVSSTK